MNYKQLIYFLFLKTIYSLENVKTGDDFLKGIINIIGADQNVQKKRKRISHLLEVLQI